MDEIVKQVKIYFCCLIVRVCELFMDANIFGDCWFTVSSGTVIGDRLENVERKWWYCSEGLKETTDSLYL